jgi:Uma2 family endonuclease
LLDKWAGERGEVGSEWHCYILLPAEKPSSLVPDVAYFSFERMPSDLGELREKPTIAPDIAVEAVSPDDCRCVLDEKIAIYLANGSRLVIVVDPQTRTVEMHESGGVRVFGEPADATCFNYADLHLHLTELFARL